MRTQTNLKRSLNLLAEQGLHKYISKKLPEVSQNSQVSFWAGILLKQNWNVRDCIISKERLYQERFFITFLKSVRTTSTPLEDKCFSKNVYVLDKSNNFFFIRGQSFLLIFVLHVFVVTYIKGIHLKKKLMRPSINDLPFVGYYSSWSYNAFITHCEYLSVTNNVV